jgi:hypothetical protein
MSSMQSFPFIKANKVKKLFKDVSEEYDMVYFGNVSQHSDEHQMVRGFTLSPSHVDRHYCVGTVSGRDVILLERTDTISFPDRAIKSLHLGRPASRPDYSKSPLARCAELVSLRGACLRDALHEACSTYTRLDAAAALAS